MIDAKKILKETEIEDSPQKKLSAREIILQMSKLLTKDEAEELATNFYADRAKKRGEAF